jgi:hypothetical protein
MMRSSWGLEILLCFALAVPGMVDAQSPHTGANTMSHTSEQTTFLERFNQPELFLVDVKNLDVQQIVWNSGINESVFTRPDRVKVRIMTENSLPGTQGKHYLEDLTYPASPYSYRNIYDENGTLLHKAISFYGEYNTVADCKDGKCMVSSSPNDRIKNPIIPIAQTRAMLQKEKGIDLYDTSIIDLVDYFTDEKSRPYYRLAMRGPDREMLIDAVTGKVLYEREYISTIEGNASIPGTDEMEGSAAYLKSAKIVKKFMEKNQRGYMVYKKHGTRDQNRFYEIHLYKPLGSGRDQIVSFLLDHKKEKVLYRCETTIRPIVGIGIPYITLWDEYQQHLKMREAEEEKPGPLSWFKGK